MITGKVIAVDENKTLDENDIRDDPWVYIRAEIELGPNAKARVSARAWYFGLSVTPGQTVLLDYDQGLWHVIAVEAKPEEAP